MAQKRLQLEIQATKGTNIVALNPSGEGMHLSGQINLMNATAIDFTAPATVEVLYEGKELDAKFLKIVLK